MKNLLKNLWSVLTSPFVGLYHLLFGSKQDDMFIEEVFEAGENYLAIQNHARQTKRDESAVKIQNAIRTYLAKNKLESLKRAKAEENAFLDVTRNNPNVVPMVIAYLVVEVYANAAKHDVEYDDHSKILDDICAAASEKGLIFDKKLVENLLYGFYIVGAINYDQFGFSDKSHAEIMKEGMEITLNGMKTLENGGTIQEPKSSDVHDDNFGLLTTLAYGLLSVVYCVSFVMNEYMSAQDLGQCSANHTVGNGTIGMSF